MTRGISRYHGANLLHVGRNTYRYSVRSALLVSASMMVLSVQSGSAAAADAAADAAVEEVVITGTRIVRGGYEAPTPLTVIGEEQLQTQAAGNIASALATMPQFRNNLTPAGAANLPSGGQTGLNSANIRGLGANRSLVLMDGQRFVPVLTFGTSAAIVAVDITNIPDQLVERVDVVTAGASAVYGSDAVGGVTNFILNKNFTGIKAEVSGGQTSYGDGKNYKVSVSGGFRFANDRAHMLLSGSISEKDAVEDTLNRDWAGQNNCVMNNPAYTATNGQPLRVTVLTDNCSAVMPLGGVIMSGPLKGTAFGPGGATYPYAFGAIAGNTMIGGSLASAVQQTEGNAIDPEEDRQNFFARTSYDLSENISVSYTFSWGYAKAYGRSMNLYRLGGTAPVVRTDNPFIPAHLRPALAGVTSFTVNTLNGDMPNLSGNTDRYVMRNALQLDGRFDMWDSEWVWNAYYQHGQARTTLNANSQSQSRYLLAADAVLNANGQIVCRSTLTNPGNGCIPFNVMGEGVNSQAAIDYLYSVGHLNQTNIQKVAAASLSGDLPFGLPAGPVAIAVDAAYRVESAHGVADPGALANDYWAGNYKPINGRYNVKEVAIEAAIPLLKDAPLAESLDLSLAARGADYSTSGFVTTWKAGSTYTPVSDLTFRGNISRDIRAGNLGELFAFAPTLINNPGTQDPFTQTQHNIRTGSTGNPNLTPEIGEGYGIGVVARPSFLPGFNTSVDFWRVKMKDAISSISVAQSLQLCFSGNAQACSFITRSGPANIPGAVGTPYAGQMFAALDTVIPAYINIASSVTKGIDLSATYRIQMSDLFSSADGALALNWNQTFYLPGSSNPGVPGSFISRSESSWRAVANLAYINGPWSTGLTARIAPKNQNSFNNAGQVIVCQSACPLISTLPANVQTWNFIYQEASVFLDANLSYSFTLQEADMQVYFNVRNILNRDPVHVPSGQVWTVGQSNGGDDALGRLMRIGVRLKM